MTTKKIVTISATLAGVAVGITGFVLMQRKFFRDTMRKLADDFKNHLELYDEDSVEWTSEYILKTNSYLIKETENA